MAAVPASGLQLRSKVASSGRLELSVVDVPVAAPRDDEVVVRILAAPINPSDLGLLIGPADPATLRVEGDRTVLDIPEPLMRAMAGRLDQDLPVGNEGAGEVIAAGASPEAQALLGRTVAVLGGAMYSQYRTVRARDALPLPAGATAAQGASAFVNPLTALAMVETLRMEGRKALVHTAAASNLGQMLVKICLADGVDLVNVVRSPAQAKILTDLGAKYVVDSSAPSFMADLIAAVGATGATLAFDAIGGGRIGSQILTAMEAVASQAMTSYSRYGSSTHKQLYIYGALDTGPTELARNFGFTWSVSGFLLTDFMGRAGPEVSARMRARVAAELTTTFASHYTAEIGLAEALRPEVLTAYNRKSTGEKYLVNPAKGL